MFDVFVMDMGGHDETPLKQMLWKLPHAQTMRYMTSHLEMIKRAANRSRTEFFWLIASCCDYSDFDFDYVPVPWEQKQIHCWASGTQKFGDTFLVNVAAWQEQATVEKLEWYRDVNYHSNGPKRLPWPVVDASNDLARSVLAHKFDSLYAVFQTNGSAGSASYDMNLWEDREIIAFNNTGHVSMCPRDAKQTIKTQIYDWPYIKRQIDPNVTQNPQDIVFISYDEKNAESNWEILHGKFPRAKRVHGITGLVPAIKTAAEASDTDWFYAVFGKTEIANDFDFSLQPDRLRHPANYVFYSYNPILDHSYGHDGVVMYDRNWVLSVRDWDLDLTMSHHVVTVPIVSCINRLDVTAWSAWRTAFRESYKLSYYLDQRPSIDDEYHLHLWLTRENTEMGRFSKLGAKQGRDFYLSNNTKDYKINDWSWLKDLFDRTMIEHQLLDPYEQPKQPG